MNFLISDALAQNGQPAPGGSMGILFFMVLIFVLFYFMAIRPQQKRAKEQREMVNALKKGDEVVTNGGTLGKITRVSDDFISLEVAAGVEIRVQRQAVQMMVPKGTVKGG